MLGLSPPRIFQCRNVRALDGPTAIGNPVVSVGPSLRRGIFKSPKPLATARVRAAQHSRVASAPRRITVPTRAVLKCVPLPRRAIRDYVCAVPRMAQSEDHIPPGTDLTARLQGASSIQIQQTIYGLDEQPKVLWLAQKCVYASLTCHGFRERA